tara:strand:- start:6292 stop:6630 length:339 start_codon:yes stop_codon:yes gene_type:complete
MSNARKIADIIDGTEVKIQSIDSDLTSTIAALSVSINQYVYTVDSDAGRTHFSGPDDDARTPSFDSDSVDVYLNGLIMINGEDYDASNGTSIILSQAADNGNQLVIRKHTIT